MLGNPRTDEVHDSDLLTTPFFKRVTNCADHELNSSICALHDAVALRAAHRNVLNNSPRSSLRHSQIAPRPDQTRQGGSVV